MSVRKRSWKRNRQAIDDEARIAFERMIREFRSKRLSPNETVEMMAKHLDGLSREARELACALMREIAEETRIH